VRACSLDKCWKPKKSATSVFSRALETASIVSDIRLCWVIPKRLHKTDYKNIHSLRFALFTTFFVYDYLRKVMSQGHHKDGEGVASGPIDTVVDLPRNIRQKRIKIFLGKSD
jgi:hypothetical protein